MKKLLAILSVVLFANQASAITIERLEQLDEEIQDIYLAGVSRGIQTALIAAEEKGYPDLICLPDSLNHGVDLSRAVLRLSEKSVSVDVAVYTGLELMFPCK